MRTLTLCAVALLAAAPARAQDLGMIEALFDDVSAVTIYYQLGGLSSTEQVTSDGPLHGAGTEVLINLASSGPMRYELGLGASYLRGYQSTRPDLDLRASLRALPTVSIYATREGGLISGYMGGAFGLIELWNAQAYGASGQPWNLEAHAFELGGTLGFYLEKGLPGLFAEASYRSRDFHSVKWSSTNDEDLPADWPRSLDLSGPILSIGWQLQLPTKDEKKAAPAPAPLAGTWLAERVDGSPLPAVMEIRGAVQRTLTHAVLRLVPAEGGVPARYELETFVRASTGASTTTERVAQAGRVVVSGAELRLVPDGETAATHTARRLEGRLYLRTLAGEHVMVFAPAAEG